MTPVYYKTSPEREIRRKAKCTARKSTHCYPSQRHNATQHNLNMGPRNHKKKNNKGQKKQQQARPKQAQKKKKGRKNGGAGSLVSKYATMISNPFTSTNHHGMFGENATGISRFKRSYGFGVGSSVSGSNTCGFILYWPGGNATAYSPTYNTTNDQVLGVILGKMTNPVDSWNNSGANKFCGNDPAVWRSTNSTTNSNTTTSDSTPDDAFLSAVASKTKLLSSGMVLRCTSAPLTLQGEYVKLEGFTIDMLLEPIAATLSMNVNKMFDITCHEPKPFKAGEVARHIYMNDRHNSGVQSDCNDDITDNSDPSFIGAGNSKTSLATLPKGTASPTVPTAFSESHQPKLYGFAFRNVTPAMIEAMTVDIYVSKEYTLQAIQGIPNAVAQRSGPDLSEPAHIMASVTKSTMDAVENGLSSLAKGLVTKGIKNVGAKYLGGEVLGLLA